MPHESNTLPIKKLSLRAASLSNLDNTVTMTLSSIKSILSSLQNGKCSFIFSTLLVHTITTKISTKKSVGLVQSIFASLFHIYFFTKSCLQSPLNLASSIPHQFFTSIFLGTTIPTIYTKNIFATSAVYPTKALSRDQGAQESCEDWHCFNLSLLPQSMKTGLTITDSLSLRLRKLVYCSSALQLEQKIIQSTLIPSTCFYYFIALAIPSQGHSPGNQSLNMIFIVSLAFSYTIYALLHPYVQK